MVHRGTVAGEKQVRMEFKDAVGDITCAFFHVAGRIFDRTGTEKPLVDLKNQFFECTVGKMVGTGQFELNIIMPVKGLECTVIIAAVLILNSRIPPAGNI